MSCPVCNGHPDCPCCTIEPRMLLCRECDGTGYIYYNEDWNEIKAEQYKQLPPKERDKVVCEKCDGYGEIEDDYEPDYDDNDE